MNKKNILIIGVIIIIMIIIIAIILSKNSSGKVPTIEEFENKAKSQDFTISTIDNAVTQSKPVISAKMAVSSDAKYTIEMYVLENDEETKTLYAEKKSNYEGKKQEGDTAKETNEDEIDEYSLKSNGNCMYIKRVKNTIISYNVKEDEEQKVSEFVKSL